MSLRVAPDTASSRFTGDGSSSCLEFRILRRYWWSGFQVAPDARPPVSPLISSPGCPGSLIFRHRLVVLRVSSDCTLRFCQWRISRLPRIFCPLAKSIDCSSGFPRISYPPTVPFDLAPRGPKSVSDRFCWQICFGAWARLGPISLGSTRLTAGRIRQTVDRDCIRRDRSPNRVAERFPDWTAVGFAFPGPCVDCSTPPRIGHFPHSPYVLHALRHGRARIFAILSWARRIDCPIDSLDRIDASRAATLTRIAWLGVFHFAH